MLMCHLTLDSLLVRFCICTGERKSWPTPNGGQSSFNSSFKTSFKSSFKSYFESSFGSSLLLCSISSVLSPFIVVLNALAFGCILNFRLTFYTLTRYRS